MTILTFKYSDCWTLSYIEYWSLEKVLDAKTQAVNYRCLRELLNEESF